MSTVNTLSRSGHLSEFNSPLDTAEGVKTPAQRKALALANLGVAPTAAELAVLDGVTAGTVTASKAVVASSTGGIAGLKLTNTVAQLYSAPAPVAKTTSVTLTAAELLSGLIVGDQGAAGAAAYTLPLAADLETALLAVYPGLATNDCFDISVINIGDNAAEDITMTTNTGWTLVGSMVVTDAAAVQALSYARFRARRTAANTYTLYRIA